jgi:UDP-glucose 4-epimerase
VSSDPVRILVTGANGRIGRRVVDRLRDAVDVHVIEAHGNHGDPDLRWPLADPDAVERLTRAADPDIVIHLAGMTGSACEIDLDLTHRVNVLSIAAISDGARSASTVIMASSAAVYGDAWDRPVDETDPPAPSSAYGASKLEAENRLAESDVPRRYAMRLFNVFGPALDTSLVNRLESSESTGEPVRLVGWRGFVRDYIHVDDVADAFRAAAIRSALGHHVLNIARGIPMSNADLIEALSARLRPVYLVDGDLTSYSVADIDAARGVLSWSPSRPI